MEVRPQATAGWRRLAELIAEIETAMLVTAESDGALRSRPLRTLQMDAHRRVSLSYMRPASERYVWASGITQILRDEEKARELWKPGLRPWLPPGRDPAHRPRARAAQRANQISAHTAGVTLAGVRITLANGSH